MDWGLVWKILAMGLYVVNIVVVVYASLEMLFRKLDPVRTLAWIIILIILPYIGPILYFTLGQNYRKKKIYNRKGVRDERIRKSISSEQGFLYRNDPATMPEPVRQYRKLIMQNLYSSHSILAKNKSVDVFFSGKEALDSMMEAIKGAKDHIHLQSYIIADDHIGNQFKDILKRKAAEGVIVRVIYDDVGCWSLPREFVDDMKKAGIEVLCFSPVSVILPTSKINYRNHRKILVVDGKVAYIGGVNIADRYCNGGPFEEWRDTHIRIEGESVFSIQASFLLDRYFIINRHIRKRKRYYPEIRAIKNVDPGEKPIYAQVISSGPDSDWASIMQLYCTAITEARNCIKIVTPYFAPSETILNAIKIAALGGIDVKIMIPKKSDSKVTQLSTLSYVSELLDAGVKVFLFDKGFNHSKVVSIDGKFCIIGSANMDNRSLECNFEITSIIYDSEAAQKVERKFNEDIGRCNMVIRSVWKGRPMAMKILESLARLLSPLL